METHLTEEIIRQKCKNKIAKYEKLHFRDINLGIIPEDLTIEDVNKILNKMIRKGYTFLAAYAVYKDNTTLLIHVSDIKQNDIFSKTQPTKKKIDKKIKGLRLGIINHITINKRGIIIDGLATLIALKMNGEKYIPYVVLDKALSYNSNNRYSGERLKIRKKLFNEQNSKCYICGTETTLDYSHPNWKIRATIDHIIPLSKGGSNSIDNCALCCSLCNQLKGDSILTDKLRESIAKQSR